MRKRERAEKRGVPGGGEGGGRPQKEKSPRRLGLTRYIYKTFPLLALWSKMEKNTDKIAIL